jgi:hypothetical protein
MTTFQDFIQLLNGRDTRGTLRDSNGHVKNDVMEIYAENSKGLKEEFFKGIKDNLDCDNFSDFYKYLGLLTVNPFGETDNERFQTMTIKAIEKLELIGRSDDFSELANFVWVLLDHMLHHWTMNDEKLMKARLKNFRENLRTFEEIYKEHLDLLYQKLGHFGVE